MTDTTQGEMPDEIYAYAVEQYPQGEGFGHWYDDDVSGPSTKPGTVVKYVRADKPAPVDAELTRDSLRWFDKMVEACSQGEGMEIFNIAKKEEAFKYWPHDCIPHIRRLIEQDTPPAADETGEALEMDRALNGLRAVLDGIKEDRILSRKSSHPPSRQAGFSFEYYEVSVDTIREFSKYLYRAEKAALTRPPVQDVEALKLELRENAFGPNWNGHYYAGADKAVDYLAAKGHLSAVPDGYVMVPIEPTLPMVNAATEYLVQHSYGQNAPRIELQNKAMAAVYFYKAMLKAAPKAGV